jgi:hypothetical protein
MLAKATTTSSRPLSSTGALLPATTQPGRHGNTLDAVAAPGAVVSSGICISPPMAADEATLLAIKAAAVPGGYGNTNALA